MKFKYLDLVKVVREEPKPGQTILINPGNVMDQLAFYTGAVGRVIGKIPGGYKVWFPVPNFADKGQAVDLADNTLKLHRGAMEADYELAHFPGGVKPERPEDKREAAIAGVNV